MAFDWKKAGLWTGGIFAAILIGYALWKYEMTSAQANAQAAADEQAADDEAAASFNPGVSAGSNVLSTGTPTLASTGTVDSENDTTTAPTSTSIDPTLAAILAEVLGPAPSQPSTSSGSTTVAGNPLSGNSGGTPSVPANGGIAGASSGSTSTSTGGGSTITTPTPPNRPRGNPVKFNPRNPAYGPTGS